MKHIRLSLFALCINTFSIAIAGTMGEVASNQAGFFIGVGGSYNNGNLSSNSIGTINATTGSPPLGVFTGNTDSYSDSAQAFAPQAQAGYFQFFNGSSWLWGLEFLYQYSNLSISTTTTGNLINLVAPVVNVSDVLTLGGLRTNVNDTLMLPVFTGHSFTNGFVYAGVGPSVFYTTQKISTVDDATSAFYFGTINNMNNSQWIWGGVVQAGLAYYVNPSWFLKLDYTCAFTGKNTVNNVTVFSPRMNNGLNSGTFAFSTQEKLVTQGVALSINKVFSL